MLFFFIIHLRKIIFRISSQLYDYLQIRKLGFNVTIDLARCLMS